jgi:hypothetical protein
MSKGVCQLKIVMAAIVSAQLSTSTLAADEEACVTIRAPKRVIKSARRDVLQHFPEKLIGCVRRSWSPPKGCPTHTILTFTLQNGDVSKIHLNRSAGSISCDKTAIDALVVSARKLPSISDEGIQITMVFDPEIFVRVGTSARFNYELGADDRMIKYYFRDALRDTSTGDKP